MSPYVRSALIAASLLSLLFLIGCGTTGSASAITSTNATTIIAGGTSSAAHVTAVTVSPSSVTLGAGQSQTFTTAITGTGNPHVTWQVNGITGGNSSVGSISSAGVYTAPTTVPTSSVSVTAISAADPTKSASAVVNFTQPAPAPTISVTVAPGSVTLAASQSQAFTASVSGSGNTQVAWQVNGVTGGNSSAGTVSSAGVYTPPATVPTSSVFVTAISVADPTKSASATVNFTQPPPPPVVVTVAPTSVTLAGGQSQYFSATVTGSTNTQVSWQVNGVAGGSATTGTITSSGVYTAPAKVPTSSVSVSAVSAADSSKSANAQVNFTQPPPTIAVTVSPLTVTLGAGQTQSFTAMVSGTSNTQVSWLVNGISGGSSTAGTITTTGLYTAPASVPSSPVSISAVSAADSTKSGSATVSFSAPLAGTNYYVSPNGNDSNDGSQQNPWATIQHAATVATAGATVHVAPGTYSGAITTQTSGTATSRIRFLSETQWGAAIRATAVGTIWSNTGDYVDIEGFDIAGNDPASCDGIINYASYVRIVGNNVHDVGHDATACPYAAGVDNVPTNAGHDDDVIGNVVHDVGDFSHPNSLQHGIYHAILRGHIWNNQVYRAAGWGIHLWHAANQVTISNNTVFNNAYGGILIGDGDDTGGFPPGVVDDYTVVTNNIVYGNGLSSAASGYGIEEYGLTGTHNQYLNNLVYQNGPANWNLQNGNTAVGSISADPQFINYQPDGSGNYHLQSSSPAIAAGASLGAPTIDMTGAARPSTSADLGIYQSNSPSGIWPYIQ